MIAPRTIFTGDNLPVLRGMETGSIDLLYLDPPFNSKHNYSAPIGTNSGKVLAEFTDIWGKSDIKEEWWIEIVDRNPALYRVLDAAGAIGEQSGGASKYSDKAYLIYMATRLIEMHRVLKDEGSIYLHCDPTMSHSLKLVMDSIFGKQNFINEIIWHYHTGGASKKHLSKKHDVILFYGKSESYNFYPDKVKVPRTEKSIQRAQNPAGARISSTDTKKLATDVWDIPALNPMAKERTGYPTQKPLELLRRIIRASSNEGDLVLDPFCGCATTCIAAEDEGREWIGIDISAKAFDLVKQRMKKELGMFGDVTNRTDIPIRNAPKPSKDIKITLYGVQGGNCAGCNTHFDHVRHFEIDHIIARSRGGADTDSNLQLLCGNCNRLKGDKPMEYLKAKLRSFGAI